MTQYNTRCDFCQRPTNNTRDADGELLCHECRHEQRARQYRPTALDAALKTALERLPATLHERLVKAHDLALSGHVARNGSGWMVRSQTTERVYRIGAAGCQCPDAQYRAPEIMGKPACKHQISVWLERKADDITPINFNHQGPCGPLRRLKTPEQTKNFRRWCDECQDSTRHGFGIGCLDCLDRRDVASGRLSPWPGGESALGINWTFRNGYEGGS